MAPPADAVLRYPAAYSPIVDLPMMTAPARRSLATTVASRVGTKSLNRIDPYIVGRSLVSTWSFTSTGMQWSGPVRPDARNAASRRSASCSARGLTVCTALSRGPF